MPSGPSSSMMVCQRVTISSRACSHVMGAKRPPPFAPVRRSAVGRRVMRRAAASCGVLVRGGALLSPAARALIEALNAELSGRYPEPGANHFRLDPDEVADDQGAFVIASSGGRPVGCGAVRRI